jgi:hypothetical protein
MLSRCLRLEHRSRPLIDVTIGLANTCNRNAGDPAPRNDAGDGAAIATTQSTATSPSTTRSRRPGPHRPTTKAACPPLDLGHPFRGGIVCEETPFESGESTTQSARVRFAGRCVIGDGARFGPDGVLGWWSGICPRRLRQFIVDFVERAPIERLSELFDSLRVDSTG